LVRKSEVRRPLEILGSNEKRKSVDLEEMDRRG
jgi:hypothetical protein